MAAGNVLPSDFDFLGPHSQRKTSNILESIEYVGRQQFVQFPAYRWMLDGGNQHLYLVP
jgi:hypothetical protein